LRVTCQIECSCIKRGESIERPVLLAQNSKIERGGAEVWSVSGAAIYGHQPVWMVIRQRPQQNSIHYAENRRIGPYPQRQSNNRQQGESRRLQHQPGAIAQILNESFQLCTAFVKLRVMATITAFNQFQRACLRGCDLRSADIVINRWIQKENLHLLIIHLLIIW